MNQGARLNEPPPPKDTSAPLGASFASPGHRTVCFLLGILAVLLFCLFCGLGLTWQKQSPHWFRVSAGFFALIWAIGTPIWFSLERWIWGREIAKFGIDIDKQQDRIRDLWIGLGAIVLVLSDHIIWIEH